MLGEPAVKITSPAATSEAAPSEDFPIDDTYSQKTLRVKKRNGSAERVDVTKIVRAIDRCCVGLFDIDPLRIAAKTISGLFDGTTTRELDRSQSLNLFAENPNIGQLSNMYFYAWKKGLKRRTTCIPGQRYSERSLTLTTRGVAEGKTVSI